MFSAAIDMHGNYADSNILLSAMMIVGRTGGGGKKNKSKGKSQKQIKKEVDARYDGFEEAFEQLKKDHPGLQLDYIRVETDIKITDIGFGVDVLKVKGWK